MKEGRGERELFSRYRVSVLQDEKVLELCCSIMRTLLKRTFKMVKMVNFMLGVSSPAPHYKSELRQEGWGRGKPIWKVNA